MADSTADPRGEPFRPGHSGREVHVIAAIDAANAEDPVQIRHDGRLVAKEPLHASLMTGWLDRLAPDADELAHIAARGHHVQRWTRPRGDYPTGRSGYLRWRRDAKAFHADVVTSIMAEHGYDDAERDRVARIVRKERLGSDPVVQIHEDALCLVFLETQLEGTARELGDDAMVDVLVRTLPKMSPRGVEAAASLPLGTHGAALLERAVAHAGPPPPR